MPTEKNWEDMFAFPLPERAKTHNTHECCDACREAREIKCVCACGGKNHGAALKKDVQRLDDALGLAKEATGPVDSQLEILRLDPLVSRELIYIG